MTEPKHSELVFGLVAPVGTNLDRVENFLERGLKRFDYHLNKIRLSELARNFDIEDINIPSETSREFDRINPLMSLGNALRERSERGEFLALAAAQRINEARADEGEGVHSAPRLKTAHLIRSLKHPEEVLALRRIYGIGFFLIGVAVEREERVRCLRDDKNCTPEEIDALLKRDEHEDEHPFGQRTRVTFQLSDVFVSLKDGEQQLNRFLNLVFGHPFETPTADEQAMFTAFAASLRSADLSRQVGAAVVSERGDIVAVGANDVPEGHGGQYWPDPKDARDSKDARDYVRGEDSNEAQRERILVDLLKRLLPAVPVQEGGIAMTEEEWLSRARPFVERGLVMDITEYGRAVHAEMEALTSCGRSGISPVGGSLFSTTFPCHNCAKHIVSAGIHRVVYVEPYPKSQAMVLFADSIRSKEDADPSDGRKRVIFEPFVGVGPRRYLDLFSLTLSSGYRVERKASGKKVAWDEDEKAAYPRVPLLATTYIEREQVAIQRLLQLTEAPESKL